MSSPPVAWATMSLQYQVLQSDIQVSICAIQEIIHDSWLRDEIADFK
jgi:hypothetical protein